MAIFRYQVVNVGWWRGKIKRWNTTMHIAGGQYANTLRTAFNAVGWPNPGDVQGDCSGGVASISVYSAAGGAPVQVNTYFDWQTPSTWIPYTGADWSSVDAATPLDASGESAAVVVGHLPGLSATGKPMTTRKYLHAVPSRTAADFSDPDIPTAAAAAIAARFAPILMLSPSGLQPSSVTVEPYYGNHQRVRGRRRTTNQVVAQSFSAGVVAGSAAGGGGGTAPEFR